MFQSLASIMKINQKVKGQSGKHSLIGHAVSVNGQPLHFHDPQDFRYIRRVKKRLNELAERKTGKKVINNVVPISQRVDS